MPEASAIAPMPEAASAATAKPGPPAVSPEQIELYGKKEPRPLLLDANVIAYFGSLLKRVSSDPRTYARALNR